MIIYILILIILVFLYTQTFENFESIVAYNNTNIPDYKIDSIYNIETNILQSIFDNLNLQNKDFKESKLDKQFRLLNINLTFPFSDVFKKIIIEYLYNNIPKYKKDQVYILGQLNNIYQKDDLTFTTFIFNFTLVNPVNFFTRIIRIRLKINNFYKTLLDEINIDENFIKLNTTLESITLDNTVNYVNFTFTPIDTLYEPYYLIKNKYYLLDPFLTSGRESIITNKDKLNFQSILNEKKKSKVTSDYNSSPTF